MTTPLSVTPDMLSTRDLSILQMGWPIVYQRQGVVRNDLPSVVNDPSHTIQHLLASHPIYDSYHKDCATSPSTALLHSGLEAVLVQQPQCTGKINDSIIAPTQVPGYPTVYYTRSSSNSKNSVKDSGSVYLVESDASSSETKEIQVLPEGPEQPHLLPSFEFLSSGSFDMATSPAFRTAFVKEVRAGQMLRQGPAAPSSGGVSKVCGTLSLNSSYCGNELTPAPIMSVESVDHATSHSSLGDRDMVPAPPAGIYCGDQRFQKIGIPGPLSSADHTGSITTELLTPSPTSDSIISVLDSSILHHSGSSLSVNSLSGASFQTVTPHYLSTGVFPCPTTLALTPQVSTYYCPSIIAGQQLQYTVATLAHPVQLQTPLAQSSAHALSTHGFQTPQPQNYTARRRTKRVSPSSGETQSPQTPFYWTREQAELFDQVHHRIGVDRATDKAIWDELRHYIPNLTQRRVQSRLQKRRLAIRKYYKLNPKSQLKRHHVHPEFQSSNAVPKRVSDEQVN